MATQTPGIAGEPVVLADGAELSKTVESHTRNVYAKLGVSSRVELVMRLREEDREALAGP